MSKISGRTSTLAVLGPLLTLAIGAGWAFPGSPSPAGPSTAVVQQDIDDLRNEFEKARQLGNKSKMDELLRKSEETATRLVVHTAEAVSSNPSEILFERYAALMDAWKRTFSSDFPAKLERFFAGLPASLKEQRAALRKKYDEATIEHFRLTQEKNAGALLVLADQLHVIATSFEELGDKYYASQAYLFEGVARDERFHGDKADLHKVADAYGKMVALRADIDLKDTYYKQTKPTADGLRGRGYGSEAKSAGEAPGAAAKAAGTTLTVPMTFEKIDALEDTERPSYYLDEHRQIWPQVPLKGVSSSLVMPRFEGSPTIIRESSAKVAVDLNGDGKGDLEWPTRGKFEAFSMPLGSGADERTWALMTEVGRLEDFYQGVEMNLDASDGGYAVYYIPAGSLVGDIAGTRVQIIDDNLDGIYGSKPQKWQHQGLAPNNPQPEVDSIRIGSDDRALPFSEFVRVGDAGWFKLAIKNAGTTLEATPTELKTGTAQLKGKGLAPDFFILKGKGEGLDDTYIDIAGGKKVELPAGRYEVFFGMVSKGKGLQRMKAVILPGPGSPTYEVTEGKTVTIEYGAPYKFDFEYEMGADQVVVLGETIRIVGAGGEVYDRFYMCVPFVDAALRKAGSKRPSAEVGMKPSLTFQELQDYGWASMWKPLNGTMPNRFEEVEVEVTEKKNKLFGKVGSDWK